MPYETSGQNTREGPNRQAFSRVAGFAEAVVRVEFFALQPPA
jgi:hypothetical protein